jgi:tetratricopeptide (TPR) repeat protein
LLLGFSSVLHGALGDTDRSNPKNLPAPEFARELLAAKRFAEAEKVLIDWLSKNPNAPDSAIGYDRLGKALLGQGRMDEALRVFEKINQRYPTHELAAPSLAQQITILQRRNPKASELLRDEMLKRYPNHPATAQAWAPVVHECFASEKYEEVIAWCKRLGATIPNELKDEYEVADALIQAKQDPQKLLQLANISLENDKTKLAKSIYEKMQKMPSAASALDQVETKLGWCYYLSSEKKDLETAESLWRGVIRKGRPNHRWYAESKWHLVQLESGPKGRWKEAVAICDEIIKEQPKRSICHEQALYTRAWLFVVQRQGVAAVEACEDVLKCYPEKKDHPPFVKLQERAKESADKKEGDAL